MADRVAQGVGPEFKCQYHKKKKYASWKKLNSILERVEAFGLDRLGR
jgi:hypothetical protein